MLKDFLGVDMNHDLSSSEALTQEDKRSKHKKKGLKLSLLVGLQNWEQGLCLPLWPAPGNLFLTPD